MSKWRKGIIISAMICIILIGMALLFLGKYNLLVWGLILLCPLMHLFGHNHSGKGKHHH